MSLLVHEDDRFEKMEQVASLRMKGISDTAIGKELNLPRKVVIQLFDEWKEVLANDSLARDAARDHLNRMVQHFDRLIKRYYDLLDDLNSEAFSHQVAGQINSALKQIAELEAKRVDALQKAGLLDASDLGDELAEREEREEILINILRAHVCNNCRPTVMREIQKLSGQVEVIRQDSEQVADNGEPVE